jgi:hypothetical protein
MYAWVREKNLKSNVIKSIDVDLVASCAENRIEWNGISGDSIELVVRW